MTVWPIFAFPYATSTQSVDQGQLKAITTTILQILSTPLPPQAPAAATGAAGSRTNLPARYSATEQSVYYRCGDDRESESHGEQRNCDGCRITPSVSGSLLTNLSPNIVANTSIQGIAAQQSAQVLQSQQAAANLAVTKSLAPQPDVLQVRAAGTATQTAAFSRQFQSDLWLLRLQSGNGRGLHHRDS